MTIGTPADILSRIKQLIAKGWFKYTAPYRDAVLGGLSDLGSWSYSLVVYARAQTRLLTAYGVWLDVFTYDFLRNALVRGNLPDATFRTLIRATILQERVTRAGMLSGLSTLTTNPASVFEPWNTFDTGAYSGPSSIGGSPKYGSMGYGVGRGGYGSMILTGQAFLKVKRSASSGIPLVAGYGNPPGGYGVGAVEYAGPFTALTGVTDDVIYRLINNTRPTGVICWVAIGAIEPLVRRPCIFNAPNAKADSQNLAII